MDAELFNTADTFNLAGELLDNSITAEGEARVRALAAAEAKKAQLALELPTDCICGAYHRGPCHP